MSFHVRSARSNALLFGAMVIIPTVLVLFLLPGLWKNLFSANSYMPHSTCYLNDPKMIWLNVITDLLIGAAYFAISGMLAYLVYKARRDIPFQWMFLAFGLFIVSCGGTHFMEVLTVWKPFYWLAGAVKLVTATASVATAIALPALIPKIFQLIQTAKASEERRIELAQINRRLMETNKNLEQFTYAVSHDLRAPLRSMQGFTRALVEEYSHKLDEIGQSFCRRIDQAAQRMDQLVTDLLHFSRFSQMEVHLEKVSLEEAVQQAVKDQESNIREKRARIDLRLPLPEVMGNKTMLVQVIENLISNAIKYVPHGVSPEVVIWGEKKERSCRIYVQDNGIGIAREFHEKIFEPFERLHAAEKYPGSGVGLAIVKKGVERMGGRLGLDSQPGKGSQFWIELGLSQPSD